MLRSTGHAQRRLVSSVAQSSKEWAKQAADSPALRVKAPRLRRAILDGVDPKQGPPSLASRRFRIKYDSPAGINEAFDVAYDFLKSRAQQTLEKAETAQTQEEKNELLTQAQIHNPEVRFNFEYNEKYDNDTSVIDYTQPVYRALKKQHWEGYAQMLLMQRLEQLAIIPDTLPTLEPKAEVSLKFLNHTSVNRWVEPGTLLSSNATMYPPSIKIQEFDTVDTANQLYTVLIVNPDVPDLENNTYKTHIQWGLTNIKLDYNDNFITPKRLLGDGSIHELIEYCPPVPEKNLPKQRFAVWVFRQPETITESLTQREFDIRSFVEKNKLEAIGAHAWRSVWDMNVPKVREMYGLEKGVVFHRVRGDEKM